MTINLVDYLRKNERVFSGRERGREVRRTLRLDAADKEATHVEVVIQEDVYSINASFFLGLFGPSIRALGEKEFRRRYTFRCDPVLRRNVEDGIRQALKRSDVLRG